MLTNWDYLVIALYLIFMMLIGLVCKKMNKNASDYFRGGGNMLWWMSGMSAFATAFTAYSFTAASAKVYETGLFLIVIYLLGTINQILIYYFFADRFRQMRAVTICDAIKRRFGKSSEQFWVWTSLLTGLFNGGVMLYIIALFVSAALGIDINIMIVALGVTVTIMAMTGGSWAVVASDFIQMLIVIVISVTISIKAFQIPGVGGIQGMIEKMPAHFTNFDLFERPSIWISFLILTTIRGFLQTADLTQSGRKFLYAKDGKEAKKSVFISLVGTPLLPIIAFTPILICAGLDFDLATQYPNLKNPNEGAYLAIASLVLPQGLIGLMVCSIFAATMSSMDTALNSNSGFFVKNFYVAYLKPDLSDKQQLKVAAICTAFFGILLILVAMVFGSFRDTDLFGLLLRMNVLLMFPMVIPTAMGIMIKNTPGWSGWSTAVFTFLVAFVSQNYITPEMVANILNMDMPLNLLEQNDLKYISSGFITIVAGVSWFLGTGFFYQSSGSLEQRESIDQFFSDMNTPISSNSRDYSKSDHSQYKVVGSICLLYGLIIMLGFLIPNGMDDRLLFIWNGGFITLIGFFLYRKRNAAFD